MKITTKSRYGLRALIELCKNEDEKLLTLKEISEKQDISQSYLEQIFIRFKKNNIVKSVKGFKGGYYIDRNIDKIYVSEVIRAIEGDITITERIKSKKNEYFDIMEQTLEKCLFLKLEDSLRNELDSVSLGNLLRGEVKYEK